MRNCGEEKASQLFSCQWITIDKLRNLLYNIKGNLLLNGGYEYEK